MKEALRAIVRAGVLFNPSSASSVAAVAEMDSAARILALQLVRLELRDAQGLDHAVATISRNHLQALVVVTDGLTFNRRARITNLAITHHVPTMCEVREFVVTGCFVAYGPSDTDLARRAAVYVDRILKGAKPADLPIERPTKFELLINAKTAKALTKRDRARPWRQGQNRGDQRLDETSCLKGVAMRSHQTALVSAFAAVVVIGSLGQPIFGQTLVTHRIPALLALEAVGEAVATCTQQGYRVTATVITPDGVRIATLHGDGSGLHTIEAAYSKAYAAVSFAAPVLNLETSGQLGERFQQQPNFQPPAGMLFRAGGVVIKLGDEVIGAIGVGGAPTANNDEVCARAGIAKIRDRIK